VTGGAAGIRDFAALESAVAQPKATFGDSDLYPSLAEKAAALCLALVQGHPFLDGNKRIGHAAMETLLVLHGNEIEAPTDTQERMRGSVSTPTPSPQRPRGPLPQGTCNRRKRQSSLTMTP
jgi:death-on-curing protein